ncbi:MAG: hypothetical protein EKK64_05000 [Neisseriaceae bacterium]|nr:MAG: hypothetical protein EKK64_05000 [Neisseriaceae bacterium]
MAIQTLDTKIKDGANELDLVITQFSATETVLFLNKLLSMLSRAKSVPTENIGLVKQAINNVMQTGVKAEDVSEVRMELLGEEVFPMMIDVIKGAIAESSEDDQLIIMEKILNQVKLRQATEFIPLSLRSIDNYVSNGMTIYKICGAVIKFNFGFLLKGSTSI